MDLRAVCDGYAMRPLSQRLVSSLKAKLTLAELAEDIVEIRYPQPGWHVT